MITDASILAMVAAFIVVVGSFCSGYAIMKTGQVAISAIRINIDLSGRMLIIVALGEAIAVYAMLLAFLIWTKI